MDLLLDEERRGVDLQFLAVVLAAPDKLRVKVAVPPLDGGTNRRLILPPT